MKSVFTKEAKIGLVTIVSLALLYLGINYLKGINLFQPVNHYYVSFSNVKGVTISSPVFVDGFKVGLVRDIIMTMIRPVRSSLRLVWKIR